MAAERFYLSQDQSSHWYVVPLARRYEFEQWAALMQDRVEAWNAPVYARPIDGPHTLSFVDPSE